MKTPICDFVKKYSESNALKLHMPGHKGKIFLGFENFDITEIDGADSLYEASGIIAESEAYASELFGCSTYYSTEGSSQCIKAMMQLISLYAQENGEKPYILAGRNEKTICRNTKSRYGLQFHICFFQFISTSSIELSRIMLIISFLERLLFLDSSSNF